MNKLGKNSLYSNHIAMFKLKVSLKPKEPRDSLKTFRRRMKPVPNRKIINNISGNEELTESKGVGDLREMIAIWQVERASGINRATARENGLSRG